ncbi:TIGR00730 family Rossman fold protein [Candidatus Margulisiibacteriota bacterium]
MKYKTIIYAEKTSQMKTSNPLASISNELRGSNPNLLNKIASALPVLDINEKEKALSVFAEYAYAKVKIDGMKTFTVFGSARKNKESEDYKLAFEITHKIHTFLKKEGITLIPTCGGGDGIMKAVTEAGSKFHIPTLGVTISLKTEKTNHYLKDPLHTHIHHHFFFIRKTMLIDNALFFLIFPGGFGTLDETFEIITLIQTGKKTPKPIIFIRKSYWEPLLQWIKTTMLEEKNISEKDLNLFEMADSYKEVEKILTSNKYFYTFFN